MVEQHAGGDFGIARVVQLADLRVHHPERGDVQMREEPRRAHVDHVAAEPDKGVRPRRSGVHGRRHAVREAVGVGWNAIVAHAGVDMHMQVHQPWRHDTYAAIDRLARQCRGQAALSAAGSER